MASRSHVYILKDVDTDYCGLAHKSVAVFGSLESLVDSFHKVHADSEIVAFVDYDRAESIRDVPSKGSVRVLRVVRDGSPALVGEYRFERVKYTPETRRRTVEVQIEFEV